MTIDTDTTPAATGPLWSNTRIGQEFDKRVWRTRHASGSVAELICREVRDDLQAEIDRLTKERDAAIKNIGMVSDERADLRRRLANVTVKLNETRRCANDDLWARDERIDALTAQLAAANELNTELNSIIDGWEKSATGLNEIIRQQQAELAERDASFELRHNADMRAIAMWQEATGKELMWPDHADMCVWLMGQLDAKDAELDRLREELANIYAVDILVASDNGDKAESSRQRYHELTGREYDEGDSDEQ